MSNIKLYHGTIANFRTVDLMHTSSNKDFGRGFYLTTDYNQARNWAYKMKIRAMNRGIITTGKIYGFILDRELLSTLNTHTFKGASLAWVDYVLKNRAASEELYDYDLVIGKVADAIIQEVLGKFRAARDNSDNAKLILIRNLKVDTLTDQYCFKTNKAINLLNTYGNMRKEEF